MVPKTGTKFENVSRLYDHAEHNGPFYLNGHCFVSLMVCVPVWKNRKISYLPIPPGYKMWDKTKSKILLAAEMVRHVMPELSGQKMLYLCLTAGMLKRLPPVLLTNFPILA